MPRLICGFLLACTLSGIAVADQQSFEVHIQQSVMIAMRDGTLLSTDLYMPGGLDEPLPTILVRTVYGKNGEFREGSLYDKLVRRGYVVAIQDIRGRYESEGRYAVATGRRNDGVDTIDWLIRQPWSNKKVATTGCSYTGETQVVLAATRHPNLVTVNPASAASGYYAPGRAWLAYSGGVFELGQTAGWFAGFGSNVFYGPPAWVDRQEWFRSPAAQLFRQGPAIDFAAYLPFLNTLPTSTILQRAGLPPTEYEQFINSLPDGEYYRAMDFAQADDRFNVPALFFDSWYDYGAAESLEMLRLFSENADSEVARDNQFIVIAPSKHCGYWDASEKTVVGERDLGDARFDFEDLQLRWYDYWMKGVENGVTDMPGIQYYLMGKNEWRQADEWPLPGTVEQRWYLGSGGNANSRRGDGVLSRVPPATANTDAYVYDPESPVPSLGGHSCCTGTDTEAGGYDQSAIELRDDVLVYTSAPLPEGIEVTGLLSVTLQVSSSAKDTDFMAKLVDVYPDGRAFNIQEGALRMRYREGMDKEVLLEPGKNYEVRLDLHASSNFFDRGHRIRLEVTSSSFPRLERNLNTGGDNHNDTVWEVATNTVHHTPERLSYLSLPVVPSPQGVAGKHEDRPLRLRVMTLNAWGAGANAGKSIDETVAVIRAAGADVVGLQETRAEGTPCLGAICPPAGPSVAADIARQLGLFVYEQKQENDALWANAILSKYPIKRATDHDLGVVLDVHGRSVAVLNIHPTDFPYQPYQLLNIPYDSAPFLQTPDEAIAAAEAARGRAVDLLLGEVETLPAVDAVFITGDFNEPSHRDWTARAAQAGRHPLAVSFPTVRRIEAAGFVDTYRSLFPDEIANPGFTWTPTTGADDPQDHHDRIVFVLMRAPGAVIEAVEIVGEDASHADIVVSPWPSDHRAVVATVALPGTS